MYKQAIFICIILFESYAQGQNFKQNNSWILGYSPAVYFNFNNLLTIDTIRADFISTQPFFQFTFGGSSISDTNGNYLLSSNSYILYDKRGYGIDNFEDINCPFGTKFRKKLGYDGFYNQMSIILPKANNAYYVFTTGMSDKAFDQWQSPNATFDSFRFDNLNYAIVDMDANNGAGKVLEKNKVLLQDAQLSHTRMSAVRHANGRDWWLVKPHKSYHKFYTFKVSDQEILSGPVSETPEFPSFVGGLYGQDVFNNNGNMYAYTQWDYTANYYINNFDRCTGQMSIFKKFEVPNQYPQLADWCTGVAFSSNDSLLYVTTQYSIYQIDIFNTNPNNFVKISGPDTLLDYFPLYANIKLAPDNKIYIGNGNGNLPSMGYIEFPNIKGLGCNFRGRGNGAIQSPYSNLLVPPNMPNYGLGVLKGSPCDTIRAVPKLWVLYPNPASNTITIIIPYLTTTAQVSITNMLGQVVQYNTLATNYEHAITTDISTLANGVYIVKVVAQGNEFISKFVKQ
jgi:Secretion system C-terminal sorting domain